MKRPSKKELQERIAKLKEPHNSAGQPSEMHVPKPEAKKGSQGKIRKKGV